MRNYLNGMKMDLENFLAWVNRLPRYGMISLVSLTVAGLIWVMGDGDIAQGIVPVPALHTIAIIVAILSIALAVTGAIYQPRLHKGHRRHSYIGRPF